MRHNSYGLHNFKINVTLLQDSWWETGRVVWDKESLRQHYGIFMIFLFDQFNFGKSESKLALIAKHLFCFYVFFSGGCLDIDNLDPGSRLFWSLVCVRAEGGPGAIF